MINRLAAIVYVIAVLLTAGWLWMGLTALGQVANPDTAAYFATYAPAALFFGIGWAFRFLLTGKTSILSSIGSNKRIAERWRYWRESFVAGATNTGNVTATVGNKLVLNWRGTPYQRDGVLRTFPEIRDKMMPGVELENFADATIASIHDDGMSPDNLGSNIQSMAMLWRVFTTRFASGTYGDLVTCANMHAVFELQNEQPSDQFKITWNISVMTGRTA